MTLRFTIHNENIITLLVSVDGWMGQPNLTLRFTIQNENIITLV